ncbi:MAG: oligosaccharide flippase family protein [Acidobacteriota bacterium]
MRGASLMVLRTLVLYPIGFAGEVGLARFLSPQDFGVYGIASFATVTLSAVMEVGLAAALIQRPEEASDEEYQTIFTLQVLIVSALVLLFFAFSPWVFPVLKLDPGVRWTLLVLLACPWISSFATVSSVKLERALRYPVFAKMDVLRGITYVGMALPLAYLGAGHWSFVAAILASTVVKAAVAFHAAPWPVRFRLRVSGMGGTLRFGALFQLSTLTSLVRDHIAVVLGGPLYGAQAVGYLNWAKNTTYYSSQIFTQVVSRVVFPSISRVQQEPEAVGHMTETVFKYVNLFTLPIILLFTSLIPEFVAVVFTNKWSPAIPAFYFYSLRMVGSNVTTLFISVLNGLGRIRTSLRVLIWWTALDWALALVLCPFMGFTGIAAAYGISVIPVSVWLLLELRTYAPIRLRASFIMPLACSSVVAIAVWVVKSRWDPTWLVVVTLAGMGGACYLLLLWLLERRTLLSEGRTFLRAVLAREL